MNIIEEIYERLRAGERFPFHARLKKNKHSVSIIGISERGSLIEELEDCSIFNINGNDVELCDSPEKEALRKHMEAAWKEGWRLSEAPLGGNKTFDYWFKTYTLPEVNK